MNDSLLPAKPPVANPKPAREPQWPGAVALSTAAVVNWLLPASLSASPGWLVVALVGILALATVLSHRWHIWFGYSAAGVSTLALGHALVVLIQDLAVHRGQPTELLQAALVIWSMNVLVFAAWYWRLDAGGPTSRSRHAVYCGGAFLFPQLGLSGETRRAIGAMDWRPGFVDYLFIAFNASTAFSPTDVPVLSAWAKVLMMIQSSIALTTLAVVAARAVNIL